MNRMEVVKQFDNKLLGRKEVLVNVETEGPTHARANVREEIAKKFKTKENLVVVNSIKSHYGSLNMFVSANIYDKKETLEKLTSKHMMNRNSKDVSKVEEENLPEEKESASEKSGNEEEVNNNSDGELEVSDDESGKEVIEENKNGEI